jgi:hypothetical protein
MPHFAAFATSVMTDDKVLRDATRHRQRAWASHLRGAVTFAVWLCPRPGDARWLGSPHGQAELRSLPEVRLKLPIPKCRLPWRLAYRSIGPAFDVSPQEHEPLSHSYLAESSLGLLRWTGRCRIHPLGIPGAQARPARSLSCGSRLHWRVGCRLAVRQAKKGSIS